MSKRPSLAFASSIALAAAALFVAADAGAASIIKDPHPPQYSVEIEPHFTLNLFDWDYHGTSYGPGFRLGIPLAGPAFVKSINDSIAISFGADLLHYEGYRYGCYGSGPGSCPGGAFYDTPQFWALYFPVVMQWNFWITDKWSAFGEPGLSIRHSFYPSNWCPNADAFGCPNSTRLLFAFYAGARYHFGDTTALTIRVGYPTGFSVGVSFF